VPSPGHRPRVANRMKGSMAKRRVNSPWGKPAPLAIPSTLNTFEHVSAEYVTSPQLRTWVEKNCRQKFVPEKLLKLWGLDGWVLND